METPGLAGPVLPATVEDVNGDLVAVDTSATYPPQAQRLPKIGYQRSLSAEGILSMKPTVAIPAELPLGAVTSMIGGPFFLWLVHRTRRDWQGVE